MKKTAKKNTVASTRRVSNWDGATRKKSATSKYLRNPKSLAPRFRRLAQAIAAAPETSRHSEISHEECEALLEFYMDGERGGENVRKTYPSVFKHLETCELCRSSYNLLMDAPAQDASRDLAASSKPRVGLPFLTPATPDAAWSKRVRSPIGGALLGFVLQIRASHLARVMAQPPQFAMRGQTSTERSLVLLDSIALGSRTVRVELWLHHSQDSDHARLEISVVSSAPLPEPLRVHLSLNDHRFSTSVEQGVGWIENIRMSDLEDAHISVEFEAGEPIATTEG